MKAKTISKLLARTTESRIYRIALRMRLKKWRHQPRRDSWKNSRNQRWRAE